MNKSVFSKLNAYWLLLIVGVYAIIQGLVAVGILNYYYQITLFLQYL